MLINVAVVHLPSLLESIPLSDSTATYSSRLLLWTLVSHVLLLQTMLL